LKPDHIGCHRGDEGVVFAFECVGRLGQQRAALGRSHCRPCGKGGSRSFYGGDGIGHSGRRRARGDLAVQRIAALESGAVAGLDLFAVNQH
jgi:hypothetical protein